MVYNLFLSDTFLKNPLMQPFLTSWQHAQTQQLQIMVSQYQFWQRLGMHTLLASQRFWLPNTLLTTGTKPLVDTLPPSVDSLPIQTQAMSVQEGLAMAQTDIIEKVTQTFQTSSIPPHTSTAIVAQPKTETEKAGIVFTTKSETDTKNPTSNSAMTPVDMTPVKMPHQATKTLKKPAPVQSVATVKKLAVDINHATQAQLLKLNGINSKKAQDIIAYREKNQGFQTINDLAKVKGIGQSTVDKNRDILTLTTKKNS